MEIIISLLILSSIVLPIALYKRSKTVRYRLIETCPNKDIVKYNESGIANFVLYYIPQVRLDGRWYFIEKNGSVLTSEGHWFLDIQDAIELIDDFSAEGNLTIPSNRKLNKNEKQIIVE